MIMTLADLDRLNAPPCMDVCPVCGSDQVHGQACIATRLFRTIARLGDRGIRTAEIAVVDAAFLKACGIALQHRSNCLDVKVKSNQSVERKAALLARFDPRVCCAWGRLRTFFCSIS